MCFVNQGFSLILFTLYYIFTLYIVKDSSGPYNYNLIINKRISTYYNIDKQLMELL